jgi:hypothetical protein
LWRATFPYVPGNDRHHSSLVIISLLVDIIIGLIKIRGCGLIIFLPDLFRSVIAIILHGFPICGAANHIPSCSNTQRLNARIRPSISLLYSHTGSQGVLRYGLDVPYCKE